MISYDEVLKELEKYRQDHYELTEEEEKLLIEARRIKVPYSKIREVFKDKFGKDIKTNTLAHKYNRLIEEQ